MIKTALVFPGQGAQYLGMGKEFHDTVPIAREIFDKADVILGHGLKDVIFNGPPERLTATANCQPAIVIMSYAALQAFRAHPKFKNTQTQFVAGLSLGEYTALAASGALSFEATLKLLKKRSEYMGEATKIYAGKMAAIIGLDKEKIQDICKSTGAEVANFNSPQQTVITGHSDKVEVACKMLQAAGAKNVVMLEVSGAFHSSLMQSAAEKFVIELEKFVFNNPEIPLVSNVDAQPVKDQQRIRENLAQQITSAVQWVDTVINIASHGVTDFIEIGPGKVLRGLIRRIDPALKVHNIEKPEDIEGLPL